MRRNRLRGQVLVLVTLALFAMIGLMGLAVDVGWSLFLEKSAQNAADSAAMGAVLEALTIGGQDGPYDPNESRTSKAGHTVIIAQNSIGPYDCPPGMLTGPATTNLHVACRYAFSNGFQQDAAGLDTRQNVLVELGNTDLFSEIGVKTFYWSTVRTAQVVPQLFSAVLGNTEGVTSAIATAAIVDSVVIGSLLLINREGDCLEMATGGGNHPECGLNLLMQGSGDIEVEGGILLASEAMGSDAQPFNPYGEYAARLEGSSDVKSDYTHIRGIGDYDEGAGGTGEFVPPPTNGHSDGDGFLDPFRGKGQPPLWDPALSAPPSLPSHAVLGGVISDRDIEPGIYYAAEVRNGVIVPMEQPVSFSGTVNFVTYTGATPVGATPGFDDYIFVGGVNNQGGNPTMNLNPAGRYVFAGATPGQGSQPATVLDFGSNPILDDHLAANQDVSSSLGEIFILATPEYPGLAQLIDMSFPASGNKIVATGGTGVLTAKMPGSAAIKSGNSGARVNIHGINALNANFPSYMEPWKSVVVWQDRNNSVVQHDAAGNIYDDGDDSNGVCDGNQSVQCNKNPPLADDRSTHLFLGANSDFNVWGIISQPRGTFTTIDAGGTDVGALQLITGAMIFQGSGALNLGRLSQPATRRVVSLVR